MFTGLVQAIGAVRSVSPAPSGVRLRIDPGAWHYRPAPGDSISVSGCCLTVAEPGSDEWSFDVVPETLRLTTLGVLKPGSRVNLEHSVTPATLMGGHFVQGHIDGVGRVLAIDQHGEHRVRVGVDASLARFLTPKGSIALDGVSLTIAARSVDLLQPWFEVALIPTTLERTTLSDLREGHAVNIEADMIAKTVVGWLENSAAAAQPRAK